MKMGLTMLYSLAAAVTSAVLFAAIFWALESGRRLGARKRVAGAEPGGTSAIDAAVFALLGLLVAFTFSGAASRFDTRRGLVVEETNDIGTAYLRIDFVPASYQPELRETFRKYVDARIAAYKLMPDIDAARAELGRANAFQGEIWRQAVAATQAPGVPTSAAILLMPALNAMFDITTTRGMATQMHPPVVIFALLFALAIAAAVLAGYGIGGGSARPWLHMVVFAAVMSMSMYVIIDIEFPRLGLIRVDDFDQALVALRSTMK
jgi:hypothetical protein